MKTLLAEVVQKGRYICVHLYMYVCIYSCMEHQCNKYGMDNVEDEGQTFRNNLRRFSF